jgi:ADP-ribose pyrophosphatase YjhB (NUDIX family)
MRWTPHVTVAAVAERDGALLFVEEVVNGRFVLNQPAGHWEEGEGLVEAVKREVMEETGHAFEPEALVGVYRWTVPDRELTYLRFCFTGQVSDAPQTPILEGGILRALWLTPDEAKAEQQRLRSPMVMRCIEDYLAGRRYPLALLNDLG